MSPIYRIKELDGEFTAEYSWDSFGPSFRIWEVVDPYQEGSKSLEAAHQVIANHKVAYEDRQNRAANDKLKRRQIEFRTKYHPA